MSRRLLVAVVSCLALTASLADAQTLGTFRWQLQPHCNIVNLTVSVTGSVFRLEGFDNQCGASQRAAAVGIAFINPDQSVGIGLTIVGAPGGMPVHVDATLQLATLSGSWRDSAGNSGTLALDANTGGPQRPLIGTLSAAAINPTQIQLRVHGACPQNQRMQAINQDGGVLCAPIGNGTITNVSAEAPLTVTAGTGNVEVRVNRTATGALDFNGQTGFLVRSPANPAPLAQGGAGARLMWDARARAFRAGRVSAGQWDTANLGRSSVALGDNVTASGVASIALGFANLASGDASVALGSSNSAAGLGSVAMGSLNEAFGDASVALGEGNRALGVGSVALGSRAVAEDHGTFVFADRSTNLPFSPGGLNSFQVRAAGGVKFFTSPDLTTGVILTPGSGSWANASDVNIKHEFRDLDGEDILRRLARVPVREWSYKAKPGTRHAGPTAQDFRAAFGLGTSEHYISTVDADGIALLAAQALELRTRTLLDENQSLVDENKALRERIERLERLLPRR